jgi:muramoyltetrapeptide carboxypeptidase
MGEGRLKIGVVATGGRIEPSVAERVREIAGSLYPSRAPEIDFHAQCFLSHGHFAGDDRTRAQAFLEIANDNRYDALWFARGGYGACRLAEMIVPKLKPQARKKLYLGYSDAGTLLAALYKEGFPNLAHGPMPVDITRDGGETAIRRALRYLVERAPDSLEPTVSEGAKTVAFNIIILSKLLGTPFEPDLTGHVLMLEEIGEYMYRTDRSLFHITSNPRLRRLAGIRMGRCNGVPVNEPDFGQTEEQVARYWCERSGIPYLGRADIGHDIDNKVVPFGAAPSPGV